MNCRIIAEAGVNHNGSLNQAFKLIDVAAESGVDVVKFQTFKAERLSSTNAQKALYQEAGTSSHASQLEMLRSLELKASDFARLKAYCDDRRLEFLSTPFDVESAVFLVKELGINTIKVPSGEVTNLPFLLRLGQLGKSFILSTGMCVLGDIELALGALAYGYLGLSLPPGPDTFSEIIGYANVQDFIQKHVTVLHCTTEYPAALNTINLSAMNTLRSAFGTNVGLSDHSAGIEVPIAAAALGASIIEKHFTLSRNLEGPDHKASLEPAELKQMVLAVRNVEAAMGSGRKFIGASESKNRNAARKVLVAGRKIQKGERLTPDAIEIKRATGGISPKHYWDFLGLSAFKDFAVDEPLQW